MNTAFGLEQSLRARTKPSGWNPAFWQEQSLRAGTEPAGWKHLAFGPELLAFGRDFSSKIQQQIKDGEDHGEGKI